MKLCFMHECTNARIMIWAKDVCTAHCCVKEERSYIALREGAHYHSFFARREYKIEKMLEKYIHGVYEYPIT